MTDIFISYKSERKLAAEHFAEVLRRYGYSVWFDYSLIKGKDFAEQIERQIRASKSVVVLWCSMSIGSRWVREEVHLAHDLGLLIPVKIEPCEIPFGWRLADSIDLSSWDGSPRSHQLDPLLDDLETKTGRAAMPDRRALMEYEQTWRRFGAQSLKAFALGEPIEPDNGGLPSLAERAEDAPLQPVQLAKGMPAATKASPQRDKERIRISAPITEGVRDCLFTPGAGRTEWFRDHELGPEMVVVPAGKFLMGTTDTEIAALSASYGDNFKDEAPQHEVAIPQPFAVGRFAITFDEWEAAQRDGSWPRVTGLPPRTPEDTGGWGRGRRPVINVSWADAQAYVKWLCAKTGQTYRLLSEAEWEYACRVGTESAFWWGDSISSSQANYNAMKVYWGGSIGEYRERTVPVDQFQPNPWGLYQVHGNVWEWVEDCWNESYADKPDSLKATGEAWTTGDCDRRVLRGGSWISFPFRLRSASRSGNYRVDRSSTFGFRLARTLTP